MSGDPRAPGDKPPTRVPVPRINPTESPNDDWPTIADLDEMGENINEVGSAGGYEVDAWLDVLKLARAELERRETIAQAEPAQDPAAMLSPIALAFTAPLAELRGDVGQLVHLAYREGFLDAWRTCGHFPDAGTETELSAAWLASETGRGVSQMEQAWNESLTSGRGEV